MKKLVVATRWLILSALFFVHVSGCSSDGPLEVGNPENSSDTRLAGTLHFDNGQPAGNADISVQSHPEYNATADSNGNFEIPDMEPGEYIVYATNLSGTLGKPRAASVDAGAKAAQFREVVIQPLETTRIGDDKALTTPGSVSGNIGLINNPENVPLVGIDVYVPGTGFIAKSGSDGEFVLRNVPEGLYTIRFERDGLSAFEYNNVVVQSNKDTNLNTVQLSLSNGPSGKIVRIADTQSVNIDGKKWDALQSSTVRLDLLYDSRATLMKVAHESSFLNVDWQPVASSFLFGDDHQSALDWFEQDGYKAVYVKFADLNGLESSVYYHEFIIDTAQPEIDSFQLLGGWNYIAQAAYDNVPATIQAGDDGTGVRQMMLCNVSSFSGCSWEDYANSRANWVLADNALGLKTVYIKVRDYMGNESNTVSAGININTHTLLTSQTGDVVLNKQQGPYTFDNDVLFGGDVTMNPGVEIHYPDTHQITVHGLLNIQGTAVEPVVLRGFNDGVSVFSGFILNDGMGGPHSIDYLTIGSAGNRQRLSGSLFLINGGSITNSEFYITDGFTLVNKKGIQNFSLEDNLVDVSVTSFGGSVAVASIENGTNNVISGNLIKIDSQETMIGQSTLINQFVTSSSPDTLIEYNTILLTNHTSDIAQSNMLYTNGGTVTVRYNHWDVDRGSYPKHVYVGGTATVSVSHNNLDLYDTTNADHFRQNVSGTVNAAGDNFLGSTAYSNCSNARTCSVNTSMYFCAAVAAIPVLDCTTSAYPQCYASPADPDCVGSMFTP